MSDSPNEKDLIARSFRYVALAAGIVLYVLILTGSLVRVTGSGGACPDWPTCFGQFTPPVGQFAGQSAAIDYTHRAAAFLAGGLVLLGAVLAAKRYHREKWISRPLYAGLGLLLVQVALGGLLTMRPEALGGGQAPALHLGLSLLIQGCVLASAVAAFYHHRHPEAASRMAFSSPFARLSLAALAAAFLLLVSGTLVAASGAGSACTSWPLCGLLLDAAGWINLAHRLVVAAAGVLAAALFVQAWRTQRTQTPVLVATTAAVTLFFAQALMGARLVQGFPPHLLALHEVTAAAVWAALVVQAAATGLARRSAADEREEAAQIAGRKGLAKDLLLLTKPIVVLLLLVTTYAGMVIGARAWPSLSLTFWTLLGGFMAAGGSGAINQYIDRYDDGKMQRTQKRPIPAGRLTAGEGLAFGVAMTLGSFFVVAAFVNFLAALLSLAGIIYYVLLYSIFLKKTTVQNIVIGGGAGAIPPLVGWAAATGSLNIPSLFLFAVVFMWTPPHFWALALVRRKDYARAGVPMLPVVRGEKETQKQIFIYTLKLVGLTLLLPVFGLGGSIYLALAGLLGLWLLAAAWKVWKQGGNKPAWKMYRYSSMYLAFLFVALMIDRLL